MTDRRKKSMLSIAAGVAYIDVITSYQYTV